MKNAWIMEGKMVLNIVKFLVTCELYHQQSSSRWEKVEGRTPWKFLHTSLLYLSFVPPPIFLNDAADFRSSTVESCCVDHLLKPGRSLGKRHIQAGNKICLNGKISLSYNYFSSSIESRISSDFSLAELANWKHTSIFFPCLKIKKHSIVLLPSRN